MQSIQNIFKERTEFAKNKKTNKAPHALSACVDQIELLIPFTNTYGRGYWLRQLSLYRKRHNLEPSVVFNRLEGLLKQLRDMDAKYPKGATLTNKLKG